MFSWGPYFNMHFALMWLFNDAVSIDDMVISEYGEIGGMRNCRVNWSTRRKSTKLVLQMPYTRPGIEPGPQRFKDGGCVGWLGDSCMMNCKQLGRTWSWIVERTVSWIFVNKVNNKSRKSWGSQSSVPTEVQTWYLSFATRSVPGNTTETAYFRLKLLVSNYQITRCHRPEGHAEELTCTAFLRRKLPVATYTIEVILN